MKGYLLNGRFVAGAEFTIDHSEPFFAHGYGLFETVRVAAKKPLFLNPHMARMVSTASNLGMDCPFDAAKLRAWIDELIKKTGVDNARLKFMLLAKNDGSSDVLITVEQVDPLPSKFPAIAVGRAAPEFQGRSMAGFKTMNYMVNRLAEAEGRKRGLDEVYFALDEGWISEGTRSTLFFVKDDVLHTPSLDLPILPGVTRLVVLHLAKRAGFAVREGHYVSGDFQSADEAFLLGSFSLFRPIQTFDGQPLAVAPGPVTQSLILGYLELAAGKAELPEGSERALLG